MVGARKRAAQIKTKKRNFSGAGLKRLVEGGREGKRPAGNYPRKKFLRVATF